MSNLYAQTEARHAWSQARRKAFWSGMRSYITGQNNHLISFEALNERLKLRNNRYKGCYEVPLDKIMGSVGRYKDFTQTFLPTTPQMKERWERIAQLYLDGTSGGLPPIELYKIGDVYFVKDGNHRVSVARQLGSPTIEAHVWEYLIAGVCDESNIDVLLLQVERADFFSATHLDKLRPHQEIELTLPGGYNEFLHQIADYQEVIAEIDLKEVAEVSFDEAVTAWFDLVYEPSVMIIEREGALASFPNRSPADLFIWTRRHLQLLEECYGDGNIRMTQAIEQLKTSGGDEPQEDSQIKRISKRVKKFLPGQ